MTPRENLLRLLRKEGYEEVPVDFSLCPSQVENYQQREHSPADYMDYFQMPWKRLPELRPDTDLRAQYMKYHQASGLTEEEIDEWGVGHRATASSLHMTQMYHPLENAETEEEILAYPLPSYSLSGNPGLRESAERLHRQGLASIGNMQCTIWETAWYIRGMENLMMDMMSDDPMAEILLDKVTEMSVQRAVLYAQAGPDILFLGDDIGMQHSLMMSTQLYDKWLKPRLKRVIDAARKVKPDLIVFYHSCGYIEPMIPYLIEAGIDVLNPVQPECMDFEEIYRKYGDRLSFHGTIGTQSVMPFGTPEEVKRQVRRNLDIAGKKGGLFVAPTHLIEPEVPWENILAYVEACREYGEQR